MQKIHSGVPGVQTTQLSSSAATSVRPVELTRGAPTFAAALAESPEPIAAPSAIGSIAAPDSSAL